MMRDYIISMNICTKGIVLIVIGVYILSSLKIIDCVQFGLIPRLIAESMRHWYRLFAFPWFHLSLLHLFFNTMAFVPLGNSLEKVVGSIQFVHLIIIFGVFAGLIHTLLSMTGSILHLSYLLGDIYSSSCGLSGVIFGLIVIDTYLTSQTMRYVFLFAVPSYIYPWALLGFIQLLVPGVSFMGHLSGMLVGYLYVWGLLRWAQLPKSVLQKIENLTWLKCFTRAPGFKTHPEEILPMSLPASPPQLRVSDQLQSYWSQLRTSWKQPGAIIPQNQTHQTQSSSSNSNSSGHGDANSNSKFPGNGHVLGSQQNP